MLNPDFPIISGDYQMTSTWKVTLPIEFNRRIEGGSLVIWRPGITIWVVAWGNDNKESIKTRLMRRHASRSEDAFEIIFDLAKGRLQYLLSEDGQRNLTLSVFDPYGHIEMAIYYDDENDLDIVRAVAASVQSVSQ